MPRPYAYTPPQNDPTQNNSVPGNHLEVPNNPHSSSSLETQNNSRKRKSNFPSSSFNSPETDDSPSKRRRSDIDEESLVFQPMIYFHEEEQVSKEGNVLKDTEDNGGNGNPDYRNKQRRFDYLNLKGSPSV
ncbi:hypothetical protein AOLI_G00100240 [Acnodon oligacanthus]